MYFIEGLWVESKNLIAYILWRVSYSTLTFHMWVVLAFIVWKSRAQVHVILHQTTPTSRKLVYLKAVHLFNSFYLGRGHKLLKDKHLEGVVCEIWRIDISLNSYDIEYLNGNVQQRACQFRTGCHTCDVWQNLNMWHIIDWTKAWLNIGPFENRKEKSWKTVIQREYHHSDRRRGFSAEREERVHSKFRHGWVPHKRVNTHIQ